jgi:hypothetical protein
MPLTTRRTALRIGAAAATGVSMGSLRAASDQLRIDVGPDRPLGGPAAIQVEPCIAADPSVPGRLIVSSAEYVRGAFRPKAWFSGDSGENWRGIDLTQFGNPTMSANNWVAYSGEGVAWLSTNRIEPSEKSYIDIYRSVDGGITWSDGVTLPGDGYDQPRMIAAPKGPHQSLYVVAMLAGIRVTRSDDSGASFQLTSQISPNNLGNQPRNPLILVDGSLVIPFTDFPADLALAVNTSRMFVIRSTDQARTFDHPHFIADVPRAFSGGGLDIATDLSSGPFRGRLYAVWESGDFGGKFVRRSSGFEHEESGARRELSFAHSTNEGKTWSVATRVSQAGRGPCFMGCLAVAPNGMIGVLWIQHEHYETNPRAFRTWFAVSVDGGETFTAAHVISRAVSVADRARLEKVPFIGPRSRGGDYIRLAADADSAFHAVWADARDGLFRIYHSRLQVSAV